MPKIDKSTAMQIIIIIALVVHQLLVTLGIHTDCPPV